MKTLILIAVLLLPAPAYAAQKYNPFSNTWETTSSDSELEYNPHEDSWSYEQKGSTLEYNPFQNKWEFAPPESNKENQRQDPYGYDRQSK